ncbi:TPA: LysE family transporter [Haemophilus influenzae]
MILLKSAVEILNDFLAALFYIISFHFISFHFISLLFSRSLAKSFYSKYSRYIDNLVGAIFLFFGGYLVYSGVLATAAAF